MKLIFALLIAATAFAQTPREQHRNARQAKRESQGVAKGTLTPEEAAKINANEQQIQSAEQAAAADGTVTKKEKAKIEHMQDKESRQIYRKKHN